MRTRSVLVPQVGIDTGPGSGETLFLGHQADVVGVPLEGEFVVADDRGPFEKIVRAQPVRKPGGPAGRKENADRGEKISDDFPTPPASSGGAFLRDLRGGIRFQRDLREFQNCGMRTSDGKGGIDHARRTLQLRDVPFPGIHDLMIGRDLQLVFEDPKFQINRDMGNKKELKTPKAPSPWQREGNCGFFEKCCLASIVDSFINQPALLRKTSVIFFLKNSLKNRT